MYEQPRSNPAAQAVHERRRTTARAHNSSLHGQTAAGSTPGARTAGHLVALHATTALLRDATPDAPELDAALEQIAARIRELAPVTGTARAMAAGPSGRTPAELHRDAYDLAGRLLVVAAAQQDTATAMLACRRMDAHAGVLATAAAPSWGRRPQDC